MKFKALKDFSHSGVNIKQDQYFFPKDVGFSKASLEFLEKKGKIYRISDVENPLEDVIEKKEVPIIITVDASAISAQLSSEQSASNNINTSSNVFVDDTQEAEINENDNEDAFVELMKTIENNNVEVSTKKKAKYTTKSTLKELQNIAKENGIEIDESMTKKDIIKLLGELE